MQKNSGLQPTATFDRWNKWIGMRRGPVLLVVSAVTLLSSLLLFDIRISEGGDDSVYIEAANRYAQDLTGYWYRHNAPGYPLFLSIPIRLFGLNLVLLKALSMVCYLLGSVLMFKAFVHRIPGVVLVPVLMLMALNGYAQYYASQTYNEAFYFMVQGVFFLSFFRLLDTVERDQSLRNTWLQWLVLGLALWLCTMVKNIGIMALPALCGFFILRRDWRSVLLTLCSFLGFRLGWEGIKSLVWGPGSQFSTQLRIVGAKNPYEAISGTEDLAGYAARFFDNVHIYLGKRLWEVLGFLERDPTTTPHSWRIFGYLAIVAILLLVIAMVAAYRSKDGALRFAILYAGAVLTGTFVLLQIRLDSPRFLLVVLPMLLMAMVSAIHWACVQVHLGKLIYPAILAILFVTSARSWARAVSGNLPILKANLAGDAYAGYTPGWANFLKMSRWCAEHLPKDKLVMSRKASMSFIHGNGRTFYPVYNVIAMDPSTYQSHPDSVLAILERDHVTHVLLASLRHRFGATEGPLVTTIHDILRPVMEKYPHKVRLVHQEGRTDPALLYELLY